MADEPKVHVNEASLDWNVESSPKGRFAVHEKFLSHQFSASVRWQPSFGSPDGPSARPRPFEVDIVKVPPGKWAWPRHYHSVQWEYYIVVSGRGEMVQEQGTGSLPMTPGDHIIQPPGWIHTIANTGDEDLVYYLTFSPRLKPGDSFSVLVGRATPHVRDVPHTDGGRHSPDYWA